MTTVTKLFLPPRHYPGNTGIYVQQLIDEASWVWHPGCGRDERVFLRFRRTFTAAGEPLVVHVSADERYELFLDGQRMSRGPDRGDIEHWAYASYRIELAPGEHTLEALAWTLLDGAPVAQLSWRGGFILKADGAYHAALTTGIAPWEVARAGGWKRCDGIAPGVFGVGAALEWSGGAEPAGPAVAPVVVQGPVDNNWYGVGAAGWKLFPSILPERLDRLVHPGRAVAAGNGLPDARHPFGEADLRSPQLAEWQRVFSGAGELVIPAGQQRFVLIDLEDYYTGFPHLEVAGGQGGRITWSWAECLFHEPAGTERKPKGNRGAVAGKYWAGNTDQFPLDGATRTMTTPWWRAGRFLLLTVTTAAEPVTLRRLGVAEERYPLEMEGRFTADDPQLPAIQDICVRGMQMCAHETYMDCPFYEQLMYVGDTRLEMLVNHVMSGDDRLVRRCVELFDFSRVNKGMVNERYPSSVVQHSPTFSLIWTLMLHDFAYWRGVDDWLRARLPGLRAMLEQFQPYRTADGLLEKLPGWPFMDWVRAWPVGNPPGAVGGLSCVVNLLYVMALQKAAELEEMMGEPLLARRHRQNARLAAKAVVARFWQADRGLLADDVAGTEFSEHAQALALLTGTVTGAKAKRVLNGLLTAADLQRTTSYFSFYLFEALCQNGRADLIQARLEMWREMVRLDCKTPLEEPEPSRSDCHAWSSQPLFHLYASLAGIRPASPGFKTVRIAPQPGSWKQLHAVMPHPAGEVRVDLEWTGSGYAAVVGLPPGITGVLAWRGHEQPLAAGEQRLCLPAG